MFSSESPSPPRPSRPQARGRLLADALAGVLAQGVRHLVAHDHGDLVVGQLELLEDARVEGDLAAGHAEGVELFGVDGDDLPLPLIGPLVPAQAVRDDALGDGAQADHLRVVVRQQRVLLAGLHGHLLVLLGSGLFELLGRHQARQEGLLFDFHAFAGPGLA
jgi:hypothetical protein